MARRLTSKTVAGPAKGRGPLETRYFLGCGNDRRLISTFFACAAGNRNEPPNIPCGRKDSGLRPPPPPDSPPQRKGPPPQRGARLVQGPPWPGSGQGPGPCFLTPRSKPKTG